jgi:uncharacterized protein (TIGR02145 family)
MGTSQLLSVPYALYAEKAGSVAGGGGSDADFIKLRSEVDNLKLLMGIAPIVSDIDGNDYHTVGIGTQVWMAENLKTTKLNDGTAIPWNTQTTSWSSQTGQLAYTWYNHDEGFKIIYGGLYDWYVVNTGKACPIGWRVPTEADWTKLFDYLGGPGQAGGKMKETSDAGRWFAPNYGADNSSGFTAMAGGYIPDADGFEQMNKYGYYWSATELNEWNAYSKRLDYDQGDVKQQYEQKVSGLSIRCMKDQ